MPPMQRYAVLIGMMLFLALFWWSWIYNPLRKHRAGLSYQIQTTLPDAVVGDTLFALSQSLNQKLSCKELSSIANLSRVTFDEIRFEANNQAHLSFYGTYAALLLCLQSIYERCPTMQISRMHMTMHNQQVRHVVLDVSHLNTHEE
jgi:hypothetical protein